jgi:hypothetical protein
MKVLNVINSLGPGGAEKLIEDALPIINKKKNIEVELLLITVKNKEFLKKIRNRGIKISIIGRKNIYNPANIIEIRKFIKNNKFDIIHTHLFPSVYWISLAAKTLLNRKFKLIYTEHSTHNRRRNHFLFRPIDKFIYKEYDKVISISQKTQNNLINWLEVNENNKFTVIENGIDVQKFSFAEPYSKKKLYSKYSEENIFITMVGSFSKSKDQRTLIKSFKKLDDNVHLFLVGQGKLLEKHKKYANNLNLNDRIHFLGFRNDVEKILKTSDIVVLSSHWEGFGLAAVEGMAAGKPVIASNVNGLKEVVKDGGLLFEQGNEKELRKLIEKLINDHSFYEEIKQRCLKKSYNYDIKNMTENLIDTYKKLLI